MAHKAGFVNIVGSPNVGKSTLMNQLVGERLSIITSKAQTTRHRIMGIVNGEDFQIVYSDTPGMIKPHYKMQEGMMNFVSSAVSDADIFLLVTDVEEETPLNEELWEKVAKTTTPKLLIINKIDLIDQQKLEVLVERWAKKLPGVSILPISALNKVNHDIVLQWILKNLPESPPYFDKDQLTDKPERFFTAEIIREKILLNYDKEIPYSVEVEVESFKRDAKITRISVVIYVARDSQKAIIIGHQGSMLKKVGTAARKEMEDFMQEKVFLELHVKVQKEWRSDDKQLKRFGYL
ncbi:MAG: GTPase Era [Flavobacteriales bacterium]